MTMTHGEGCPLLFQPGDTSPRPCVRQPGPPPLPDSWGALVRERPPNKGCTHGFPKGPLFSASVLPQSLLGAGLLDLRAASVERYQAPGPSQRDVREPGAYVRLGCEA